MKPSETMSLRKSGSWTRFSTSKTCSGVTPSPFFDSLFQKAIYLYPRSGSTQPFIVAEINRCLRQTTRPRTQSEQVQEPAEFQTCRERRLGSCVPGARCLQLLHHLY